MSNYIVRSQTRRPENHTRCWHNIALGKLERAAKENAMYVFIYTIDGKKYSYRYPARELLDIFERKCVSVKVNKCGKTWNFFGNYRTGALYRSLTSPDKATLVTLEPW